MTFEPSDQEVITVRFAKDRAALASPATCEASYQYPNEEAAGKFAKGVAETGRHVAVVSSRRGILATFPILEGEPELVEVKPSDKIRDEAQATVTEFAAELPAVETASERPARKPRSRAVKNAEAAKDKLEEALTPDAVITTEGETVKLEPPTKPVVTTSMAEHRNPVLHAVEGEIVNADDCSECAIAEPESVPDDPNAQARANYQAQADSAPSEAARKYWIRKLEELG